MNWKADEIALTLAKRKEGKTWAKIASEMDEDGWPKRSPSNYSSTIARLTKKYDLKVAPTNVQKIKNMKAKETNSWKDDPATRRQCKFIASLTLPNATTLEKGALEHQLCEAAKAGKLTKEVAGRQITLLGGSETKTVRKPKATKKAKATTNKGWVRWSKEEDAILMEHREKNIFPPTHLFKSRTEKAISQRLYRLKNSAELTPDYNLNTASTKEDYQDIHRREEKPIRLDIETIAYPRTEKKWSEEETLSLLVSLPMISIDEARETYGRPYWVIAKHYEKHYDLSYDNSASLVMKATEIRNQLKDNAKPVKGPSLLKRIKDRRIARKQKRLDRKMTKMETKLSKLRGE